MGLRMDDSTFQIAVSLRLGLAFCKPHSCHHCGCEVTAFATHGLSCVKSQGRYHHHSSLNDIIHRAFGASRIPSRLEPSGISRSDGKRPDGATLVPWKCGKLLVWDATCVDTYAPSYSRVASQEAGAVADQAEKRKWQILKYGPQYVSVCSSCHRNIGCVWKTDSFIPKWSCLSCS